MVKKILPAVGYWLLFFAALLLFVVRGIDQEWVMESVVGAVGEKTGFVLSMKSMSLSLPFSATMNDVSLGDKDGRTKIRADSVEISPVYWRLLMLRATVAVTVRVDGGWTTVEVSRGMFPARALVSLESRKFQVNKAVLALDGAAFPIEAELDATAGVSAPLKGGGPGGEAVFYINKIKLSPGSSVSTMLSGVVPTSAKCRAEVKDGNLATKECSAESTMGKLDLRLTSKLMPDASASPIGGSLVIMPAEKAAAMLDVLYGKFRKPDGAYYLPIGGTFGNPRIGV
ncbi:MAG: type II secretion system protein GspN [Nitrospinae bacterium]|nr:type II secretion system protein GspN [Nitrospinota bacterium]